ncbi:G-protein coupled receptor Mth2-like isoform X1 [Topomyia yanbarensis]|uniref:G-protein coupled receptor Mth2-like isoform X1 n=1 Tax=Topomyia yanbarensis TaxID=2498891 RepID=UPI00273B5CB8|nr:G-protein coupled receptor Mth2-like isoform X1 [Topomyia yanbarensis]
MVWYLLSAMTNGSFLSVSLLALIIAVDAVYSDGQLRCEFRDSVNISGGVRDGQQNILYGGLKYGPEHYALINYDYVSYDEIVEVPRYYRGCICQLTNCVRLCCPVGEWFSSDGERTICNEAVSGLPFKVWANISSVSGMRVANLLDETNFGFVHHKPCPGVLPGELEEWYMDDHGTIQMVEDISIPQDEYCLAISDYVGTAVPYLCPLIEQAKVTYSIGIILSIPFLLATLFIYACIPELRNIHGKSLICYILALTFAYVMLLLINFHCSFIPCNVMGYMLYFSVLVSFFWLNVMCFDIFWTFSSGVVIKNERKRFIHYALYAFGCPTVILIIALVFDHTELIVEEYRPRFGEYGCFIFRDKLVEFIYFYLPLLILVMANLYFFVVTAIRIVRIQHATDVALRNGSRRHSKFEKDRHRFSLYLRLFIVMGVTWTFEIVSWAVGSSDWFFYVSDVCNCLLGVIIFFLFVWKQKVRQLVVKRIGNHQELRRRKSTSASVVSSTGATKFTSIQDSTVTQPPVNA